jgi:hypothetical protein
MILGRVGRCNVRRCAAASAADCEFTHRQSNYGIFQHGPLSKLDANHITISLGRSGLDQVQIGA